jgi:hypothetical protein
MSKLPLGWTLLTARKLFPSDLIACDAGEISRARFVAFVAAAYGCSLVAVRSIGLRPAIPFTFLTRVVLVNAPIAICAVYIEAMLEHRREGIRILVGALLAVATLLWCQAGPIYLVAALLFPYTRAVRWNTSAVRSISFGLIALVIAQGTVSNLNYLAAAATPVRLHDRTLLEFDRSVYSLLRGDDVKAAGMFPLITDKTTVKLFENAYVILFPEIILVVVVLSLKGRAGQLERFLLARFASYGIAVIVFLLYPVVGPPIYRPETFSAAFGDSLTREIMTGMATEYHSTVTRSALNGLAYFIAVPSLHVIEAVLMQWFLWESRLMRYCFLPINLMIVLSTVVLGYHYIADLVAGLAVAAFMIRVFDWPRESPQPAHLVGAHGQVVTQPAREETHCFR